MNDAIDAAADDAVSDEIADIEQYAQAGKRPPRCRGYKIRVNKAVLIILEPTVTGRQILTEAGLTPPEDYTLRIKTHGGRPEKVGLDDPIDLTRKGVEKFKALPRDQTDG